MVTRRSTRLATSVTVKSEILTELDDRPRPAKRLKTVVTAEEITEDEVLAEQSPAKNKRKTKGRAKDEPKPEDYRPRVSSLWKVGAHVSAAGGVENAVQNAAELG